MGEKRDLSEAPVFDVERANEGIRKACQAFDDLDMTLSERFWACHCILAAASSMLGSKYAEIVDMMREKYPELYVEEDGPAE